MILDTINRKIQVVLAGTVATLQLPVTANWVDMTPATTVPGASNTQTNNTTQVDVVAAPAASTQRVIQSFCVYNKDSTNATVSVIYDDTGTDREIIRATLLPGQSLVFTIGAGWTIPPTNSVSGVTACFHAHKSYTDQAGIAAATTVKVTFPTEVFDVGNYYDPTLSRWTPPAGKILIAAQVTFLGGTINDQVDYTIYIYKNGVGVKAQILISSGSLAAGPSITFIDEASGTDYYEVFCQGAGTGTKTVSGNPTITFFSGTLLNANVTVHTSTVKAAFSAHKNAVDQTGIVSAVVTKVTFGSESYDTGSYYDSGNSRWTPPAGKIRLTAAIAFGVATAVGGIYICGISKNGSTLKWTRIICSVAGIQISVLIVAEDECNGTDYYEVICYGDGAGSKTVMGALIDSWFQGSTL